MTEERKDLELLEAAYKKCLSAEQLKEYDKWSDCVKEEMLEGAGFLAAARRMQNRENFGLPAVAEIPHDFLPAAYETPMTLL